MAGATELFRLAAKLVLDTDEFSGGIAEAKREVSGLGSVFGGAESGVTKLSSAMNVAKTVAGVAGVAIKKGFDIGKTLVESAASMSALDQSMAATFEGVEEEAAAAFAAVGEANNIAERRLQQAGLGFYRQFLGAGMDSANAMVNMENALGYAADAAAAYDISLEDASQAMRSFIRGNTEAGEAIGIFVSEKMREDMAMEEYGKKWKDLTEAERQFLLLDLVGETQKQNKVMGQGAREADNYSNVVGNLQSAWSDAMATMGDSALPHVTTALKGITTWIEDNPDVWTKLGEGIGWVAEKASGAVVSLMETLGLLVDIGREQGWRGIVDYTLGDGLGNTVVTTIDAPVSSVNAIASLAKGETPAEIAKRMGGSENRWDQIAYAAGKRVDTYLADVHRSGGYMVNSDNLWQAGMYSFTAPVQPEPAEGAEETLQSELGSHTYRVYVQPYLNSGGSSLADATFWDTEWIPHARGLEYVPTDGYPALLHRGESVLNRVEAENWRAAQRGGMMGFDPAALGAAVAAALAGVTVNIDGHTAGALLTPYVSKEQYKETWKRR